MGELLVEIAGSLMRLLWGFLIGVLEHGFLWMPSGSKSKSRRKPSKLVKVVIKSKNGEKHGVLEDHKDR